MAGFRGVQCPSVHNCKTEISIFISNKKFPHETQDTRQTYPISQIMHCVLAKEPYRYKDFKTKSNMILVCNLRPIYGFF